MGLGGMGWQVAGFGVGWLVFHGMWLGLRLGERWWRLRVRVALVVVEDFEFIFAEGFHAPLVVVFLAHGDLMVVSICNSVENLIINTRAFCRRNWGRIKAMLLCPYISHMNGAVSALPMPSG